MSAVFSALAQSPSSSSCSISCQPESTKETRRVTAESLTRVSEYSDDEDEESNTMKYACAESDDESTSYAWAECDNDDENTLPWRKEYSTPKPEGDDQVQFSRSRKIFLNGKIHPTTIPILEHSSVASSLPSNPLLGKSRSSRRHSNGSEMKHEEKLVRENQRLKKEVCRLLEEAREKDALISTLESQIMALVVDGRDTSSNSKRSSRNSLSKSNSKSNGSHQNAALVEDDDIESDAESATESKRTSVFTTRTSVTSSLCPPKRITVEMRHPPAPVAPEPRKQNWSLPPSKPSRKTCFQKSTAAIKALPRELSISNHSRHLFDDEDDSSVEEKEEPLSETYQVTKMEFIDAYNSRGIYSGTVQRATQMPHGKGKMIYHRGGRVGGRYYDGYWHVGHWHGTGVLRDASGDIYEGAFVNDLREGVGTIQFTDGRIFQGIFREDEASNGTMSYIDGAEYEGELHHGNRHGFGVYRFSDGSYYKGDSVMNLFEGKGTMTWSDGGWYEGEWSKGEIHGFGKEYRPDGSLRHDGRWIKGVPIRITNNCCR